VVVEEQGGQVDGVTVEQTLCVGQVTGGQVVGVTVEGVTVVEHEPEVIVEIVL
jgi:hypothetical protein